MLGILGEVTRNKLLNETFKQFNVRRISKTACLYDKNNNNNKNYNSNNNNNNNNNNDNKFNKSNGKKKFFNFENKFKRKDFKDKKTEDYFKETKHEKNSIIGLLSNNINPENVDNKKNKYNIKKNGSKELKNEQKKMKLGLHDSMYQNEKKDEDYEDESEGEYEDEYDEEYEEDNTENHDEDDEEEYEKTSNLYDDEDIGNDWYEFDGDLSKTDEQGTPNWLRAIRTAKEKYLEEERKNNDETNKTNKIVKKIYTRKVDELGRAYGTGRRKTSIARIWISPRKDKDIKNCKIIINKKHLSDYFPRQSLIENILAPFLVTNTFGKFDVFGNVHGGGHSGQSGAIRLGISRALQNYEPKLRSSLKKEGFLTRDPRMVERKKPGQPKARKKKQWVKR